MERVLEEKKNETDDLHRQIEATNKQLVANRKFLEEQSVEREVERDELQQNVEQLEKLKRDSESWRGREQRLQRELQEQEESLHEKTEQVSTQRQRLEQLERSDVEQKASLVELRDVISQLEAELEAQAITKNPAADSLLDHNPRHPVPTEGDTPTSLSELSHTIQDLESQVVTLRRAECLALESVVTLEDELKNMRTLEEELTHDKEALQCQVDNQMTAMNGLKSQLDSLKVTAAGDTERMSPVSPSLQHQLEQERTALTNSSEEMAELTEQLEQFRDQLIERDEQLQQMAAQIVISEKRSEGVDELKNKIQQLQTEVNQDHDQEAFSMPVFAQQLIDEKNAEIDYLNKHILQLQAARDSSPDTATAANNDQRIEILQQQLDQVSEELSATQERLSASQEQRSSLEEQLIGAKEETRAMKTEAESAHEELAQLYKKRDERDYNIKQQVEALEHEMARLRTEHAQYRNDTERSMSTIETVLHEKDSQLSEVEEHLKSATDTLEEERSNQEQQMRRNQDELTQLQEQLQQAMQLRQTDDSNHQMALQTLQDDERQKEAAVGRLSSELVEARDIVERSREAGVRMEAELRELQGMLRKRQEELEMLTQQLERTQVDGFTAETQVKYESAINELQKQLKDRQAEMDETTNSHREAQRDLRVVLEEATITIQGQEQQVTSLKATQHDLRHEVTDLCHEVAILRDQLSHQAGPEKGGGDAESSPSNSVTVKEGKTSAAEVHARVQKLEQLLVEMSSEHEQRLDEVRERLHAERQESVDQIRRQLQKHHTDEINRLIVDHQRELQRLQPIGETSDDDSLIELARKVHVEIDRNEQIDSRMMGYLKCTGVDGASDVVAPSSATTSSSRLVHSAEGSTEQATTLQGLLRKIHSEGIKKLSVTELHLLRSYGDAASRKDDSRQGWEEERRDLIATINSLTGTRVAAGFTDTRSKEGGAANAPEKPPQVVSGRQLESSDVESAVNDEKERQMEERRKEEDKHQVVENQLKRQVELLEFKLQQDRAMSDDLRSSLDDEKGNVREMSSQLSEDRTSRSRFQTEIGDMQSRITLLQDALVREQARLVSTSFALEEQRRQVGQLNEAVVIEKANSAQCMDRLGTEKEHSLQYRERTNLAMQKLRQDIESEKQSHLEAASALERERLTVSSLRRELDLERDQLRNSHKKYKAKIEQLRTSADVQKSRCEEINNALHRERQLGAQLRDILDDERSSQQDVSERERATITDLQALLDLERSKLVDMQGALQRERDTVVGLNDDLLSVKTDFSETLNRERVTCRQLKVALETMQAQKDDLTVRVELSQERLHEMQTDRDRWQASGLASHPCIHQAETPYEDVDDSDRLRRSISESNRLIESSAEIERVRETVAELESQLAATRRAEVEAREACNLLRLKNAMVVSSGGVGEVYGQHHSNGNKMQDSPLPSERAPDTTTRRTVVARKQMESLRQQLQFLCIRLQEDLAQCILRTGASLHRRGPQHGGIDHDSGIESTKTTLKDILFELQELQMALNSAPQGDSDSVDHVVSGLNERILGHNNELTSFISRLSEEKQHLRRTLSIMEQDMLQYTEQKRRNAGDMRDRNDLSLQLSHLERELASTEGELHRVQMERDSALRSHSPSQSDSTTDRLKLQRLYGRYLKSESFRKALIYQKKYLLVLIGGFQDSEEQTLSLIAKMGVYPSTGGSLQRHLRHARPFTRFRSAVRAVIAISRLRFLVRKWRRATRGASIANVPTSMVGVGSPRTVSATQNQHSTYSDNQMPRQNERLYQSPSSSTRYRQSAMFHSSPSLHTSPSTHDRSVEFRRRPQYASPLAYNSSPARREMPTALDPMLESTPPPPPPSLCDGSVQSPHLSYTSDQDNYIERLEHLQLRLGAVSHGSVANNRR